MLIMGSCFRFSNKICSPFVCVHAKSLQLCPTLLQPYGCSSPGSSAGFSMQEYWIGLPFPPPGDLPDSGIEPASLMCPAQAGGYFITSTTWEAGSFA